MSFLYAGDNTIVVGAKPLLVTAGHSVSPLPCHAPRRLLRKRGGHRGPGEHGSAISQGAQVHPGPAHRPRPAANTSKELSDRDKWSQFIGGMLGAFLQPGPLLTRQC